MARNERVSNDRFIRIGSKIINKDDISYIDLNGKTAGYTDSWRIYIFMRSRGHLLSYSGEEREVLRAWLLEQFPCDGQSLDFDEE